MEKRDAEDAEIADPDAKRPDTQDEAAGADDDGSGPDEPCDDSFCWVMEQSVCGQVICANPRSFPEYERGDLYGERWFRVPNADVEAIKEQIASAILSGPEWVRY